MSIERDVMRMLAQQLNLNGDVEEYNAYYELFKKARAYDKENEDAINSTIQSRVRGIKKVVERAEVPPSRQPLDTVLDYPTFEMPMRPGVRLPDTSIRGMTHVRRRNVTGSYVVFSDHHIYDRSSRQDFFSVHNKALYLDILTRYYGQNDWHLVENGDLEELLIYEPVMSELNADGGTENWDWPKIRDYRAEKIREYLPNIVEDNRDYYDTIWAEFASQGRYHKLVGNHDVALLDTSLMDVIRQRSGHAFENPAEVLLLSDNQRHRYFICHGHQFDHSCTPGYAEYLGETYSQAGAWAFEGPDRSWKWANNIDFLEDMLAGTRPVLNEIVGIEPSKLSAGEVLAITAVIASAVSGIAAGSPVVPVLLTNAGAAALLQAVFSVVSPEKIVEGITGKAIAMEYFANPNQTVRLAQEITSGTRWFKFRHMDEIALSENLLDQDHWGETPVPTVVLGHSHEPRLNARYDDGDTRRIIGSYINSGAAGRFANLIWAVEIVNGRAAMVSWHYPDNDPGNDPVRTVWSPRTRSGERRLEPSSSATIEDPATQSTPQMAPILNLMLPA